MYGATTLGYRLFILGRTRAIIGALRGGFGLVKQLPQPPRVARAARHYIEMGMDDPETAWIAKGFEASKKHSKKDSRRVAPPGLPA